MKKLLLSLTVLLSVISGYAHPVKELIERVAPGSSDRFELVIKKSKSKKDFFELSQNGDKVQIVGNNFISLATGFNWYVKYYAKQHLSWNNMLVELPTTLPKVNKVERRETEQTHRFYLNYCTFSYSMAFWDWERWQTELDWMALHGINLSLSITGAETVWLNLMTRLGYSRDAIDQFISGPAFMAWWQMNNLEGWGGPNTDRWYEQQANLQKLIVGRMHELGIEPVLPGYAGILPSMSGDVLDVDIQDPGKWCGFNRPAFLQPTDKKFAEISDMYYEELTKLYGKVNYYSMDPFHEGGSSDGVDLALAGKSIMSAMKRANPESTWVIQAWQVNPRPEMIDPLKPGDLLVLDLNSDSRPMSGGADWSEWYRKNGYGKHDWVFNMLLDFGGRTGLYGKFDQLINTYYDAKAHVSSKRMKGVGATMESIENNTMMYELLYELPWRTDKFDGDLWLKDYLTFRYGSFNNRLYKGWLALKNSIYNCPKTNNQDGPTETVFAANPSLKVGNVSCCSTIHPFYDTDSLIVAAELFLSVADQYGHSENYQYDIVDIVRQTVANRGYHTYQAIVKAHQSNDIIRVKTLSKEFLELILAQDKLLSTEPTFMLGRWTNQARKIGVTLAEKNQNEWNARTLISVWGTRESAYMLDNYAYKEWSGILKDLYYPRWRDYFTNLILEMETGLKQPAIDFFGMAELWTNMTNYYPDSAQYNPLEMSKTVFNEFVKEQHGCQQCSSALNTL